MPIFVKYEGVGGEYGLEDAFLKIDADFLKLSSASADTFVKVEAEPGIKHDINVIGDSFFKESDEFLKISDAGAKIDAFFLKLAEAPTASDSTIGGGTPDVQSDVLKVDATLKTSAGDLSVLGSDFLKLDTAPNLEGFKSDKLSVGDDFGKVGKDMSDAGGAFTQLGTDLIALGTGPNSNTGELNDAFKMLGGELDKVGSMFDAVALDFQKLSQDFAGEGGGVNTVAVKLQSTDSMPTGVLGADFLKLEHDFLLLNQAIAGTAMGVGQLFDALVDQGSKAPSDQIINHMLAVQGGSSSPHG